MAKSTEWQNGYRAGFEDGIARGGQTPNSTHNYPATRSKRRSFTKPEDTLIADYIKNKTTVFCNDIVGFIGWADNRGNQISIGHTMKRLGWIRRRERPPSRRWFYERGPDAASE